MSRRTPLLRTAVILLAGLLLLAGCTGSSDGPSSSSSAASSTGSSSGSSSGSSTGTPTAPSSSAAPTPPAAPRRDACYQLSRAELTTASNESSPVPCTAEHNTRTFFVGTLDTVVQGHSVAVDSATVQRQLSTVCPRKLAAHLGGSQTQRDLSRFNVVWFSPTLEESDQGADWFRCDLIAFAGSERLLPLPRSASLQGVLDKPGALDRWGLCGTAAPGAAGFQRVICQRPHRWRAFATIPLEGGAAYPGVAKVRAAGDDVCKDRARDEAEDTLKFTYGWEWPTRAQWASGQRYGYCWVPSTPS